MYSASDGRGGRRLFGSSGLLYRANKLMYDRESFTLWHNLTGEAVFGRDAGSGARLATLPVVVSTWGGWRAAHPETTVVSLSPIYGERWGFTYQPGAADRHRAGVRFPVWQKSARLAAATEILGVRIGALSKAYPVAAAVAAGVVNDRLGDVALAVVAEPASGALRVYRRSGHSFRLDAGGALLDETGRRWQATEEALLPAAESAEPALERLPSHLSFWFGWFGFFPETELYEPPSAPNYG